MTGPSDVMLARLRPDRPGSPWQHVVPVSAGNMPTVLVAYCGARQRAVDIDPRFVDRLAGMPCPACICTAPSKVIMDLTRMSGELYPADDLGESTRPEMVGPFVYASGIAALELRHIVPDGAVRYSYQGRVIVGVECGHMAWCPRVGPFPSPDWPVCAECLAAINRRASQAARLD